MTCLNLGMASLRGQGPGHGFVIPSLDLPAAPLPKHAILPLALAVPLAARRVLAVGRGVDGVVRQGLRVRVPLDVRGGPAACRVLPAHAGETAQHLSVHACDLTEPPF